MSAEPVLPQWLIEAAAQLADTWIPVQRMPGVPGPVRISLLGLVGVAYVTGFDVGREQFGKGVPAGARVVSAEQWQMLRSVLCEATGWSTTARPPLPDETLVAVEANCSVEPVETERAGEPDQIDAGLSAPESPEVDE